jgi:hypothetical protein
MLMNINLIIKNTKIYKVYKNINKISYLILFLICVNSKLVFSNEENNYPKLTFINDFKNEKITILIDDILFIEDFNFISDRKIKNSFWVQIDTLKSTVNLLLGDSLIYFRNFNKFKSNSEMKFKIKIKNKIKVFYMNLKSASTDYIIRNKKKKINLIIICID